MTDAHPDFVSEGACSRLLGATIEYQYSTGNHYRLIFDHDFHVTFEMLHEAGTDTPPPPVDGPSLSYRAKEIRPDLILIHWIVKDAAIHVSLSIDLAERKIHAAAMMPPNRWEFWDTAEMIELSLNDREGEQS